MGISGCKRADRWKVLNNEELHNLYSSPIITIVKLWTRNMAHIVETRNVYSVLTGNILREDATREAKILMDK
jgi:hypothetical protein